ncbi:MAG: hypothetical protein FWC93_06715 [Defluviitaleaceae bacterium]|nr:hypothetical protein [Defluviitaleaceae bacterium]
MNIRTRSILKHTLDAMKFIAKLSLCPFSTLDNLRRVFPQILSLPIVKFHGEKLQA